MYYIKPKITIEKLNAASIKKFNPGKEVLIVSSKTVYKNQNLADILKDIGEESQLHIFTHIRPDAPFEDLDHVIEKLKEVKLDSIIAIGGGSIIDAAKALSIAFGETNYKDVFYGRKSMPSKKIKLLAIPTTAGTGAELSFGAILYDKVNGKKGGVRGEIVQPDYVLLDARLHNSCPTKLKAEVGFDCLTHAVETYISKKSSPLVKLQSVNCIKIIFEHLIPSCKENSLEHMEKVAIVSCLMGINLAFSSTCLPHRLQYVIGPMTGTSHAQGLIALYKGWLRHLLNKNINELQELADDLNMTAEAFVDKVEKLKVELNIDYNLEFLGLSNEDIDVITQDVSGSLEADPSYKDHNSIKNILKLAL